MHLFFMPEKQKKTDSLLMQKPLMTVQAWLPTYIAVV